MHVPEGVGTLRFFAIHMGLIESFTYNVFLTNHHPYCLGLKGCTEVIIHIDGLSLKGFGCHFSREFFLYLSRITERYYETL